MLSPSSPSDRAPLDEALIVAVVDAYLAAAREGRSALARPLFEPGATVRGRLRGEDLDIPVERFLAHLDESGPARDLAGRAAAIDIAGTAASARVEAEAWHGVRYTDFLALLRRDGTWLITGKVFFAHEHAEVPLPEEVPS